MWYNNFNVEEVVDNSDVENVVIGNKVFKNLNVIFVALFEKV